MKDYRSSIEKKIVDTVHPYKIYENKRIPGQWATYIYDCFRKGKRRNIRRRNYNELIEHNPIHDVDFKRLPFKPVPDKQEDVFTREEAYKLLTYAYNGENLPQLSRMMGCGVPVARGSHRPSRQTRPVRSAQLYIIFEM